MLPALWRAWRRFIIARALRRLLPSYRIGRAAGREYWTSVNGAHARVEVQAVGFDEVPPEVQAAVRQAFAEMMGVTSPVAPQTASAEPGRQSIATGWSRPFPAHAHSALWEDLHEFAAERPKRDAYVGLNGDPPVALVCPACELTQRPFAEYDRTCSYCGLRMHRHGSRVFWWRDPVEVKEWEVKR